MFDYRVMPERVLCGWSAERDFADILGGIGVGWVHSPAALIAQARRGQGKLLAITLKLERAFVDDPMATILLQNMIACLMSPRFTPEKDLSARPVRAKA